MATRRVHPRRVCAAEASARGILFPPGDTAPLSDFRTPSWTGTPDGTARTAPCRPSLAIVVVWMPRQGPLPQGALRKLDSAFTVGERITFVGLDVHKATIAVCVAQDGRDGEVRFVGEIPNEPAALDKLLACLGRGGRTLRFVYEAGPCGYGVYRHLRDRGHDCVVVAPSLIPHKLGELTPVWVPEPEHEAMRDLVRARADMVEALGVCRVPASGRRSS